MWQRKIQERNSKKKFKKTWLSKSLLDSIDDLNTRIDTVQIKRREHLKNDGEFSIF